MTGVELVPEGSVNRVFRVQTVQDTFYFRMYRIGDETVLEREVQVMAAARAGGVPVPMAVVTRSGADWLALDGQLYMLFTAAEGTQVPRSELNHAHATAAGECLARLHRALERLPDLGWRRYRIDFPLVEWLARLNALEQAVSGLAAPDGTDVWALARLRAQREWLADPGCPHAAPLTGPRQVIHGDYHDGNLFFVGSATAFRVSGVIDWEQAAWMPRAFEPIRSAHYMFGHDPPLASAFLNAYVPGLKMKRSEMQAAALVYGVQADHNVWALEEAYLRGNARARRFIPHAQFRPFSSFWREVQERLQL
ncbi:phosphotransferase [Deinococcus radiomollis]|uniref:phosphotransferase n=1 Tax=Deinococcus radiomollis TaxID=468916 RepID=UPI003891A8FC